jgi:hypothetical protein
LRQSDGDCYKQAREEGEKLHDWNRCSVSGVSCRLLRCGGCR